MRTTALLLASSLLFTACSVEVSTELVSTTAAPEGRAQREGTVVIPRDSADAAVAALLVEWADSWDEFRRLFEPPEMIVVGDIVTWQYDLEPRMNSVLDRMKTNLNTIATYVTEESLSASTADIANFVALGRTFIAGHRLQLGPEFSCIATIPDSAYSKPLDDLFTMPDYVTCVAEAAESQIVEETTAAGSAMLEAYDRIYEAIVTG